MVGEECDRVAGGRLGSANRARRCFIVCCVGDVGAVIVAVLLFVNYSLANCTRNIRNAGLGGRRGGGVGSRGRVCFTNNYF